MMNFVRLAKAVLKGQKGQGMVEYALILSAVAVVGLTGYKILGKHIDSFVTTIARTYL